ncbi:MAG: hypothetical protein P1V51_08595 [Deltaproteobacteria bacterium]|nr:hypothetical protein [Deltaproteobacteria bacterium]
MIAGLAAGAAGGGLWLLHEQSHCCTEEALQAELFEVFGELEGLEEIEGIGGLGLIGAVGPTEGLEENLDAWDYLAESASVRLFHSCRGDREKAALVHGPDIDSLEDLDDVCISGFELPDECAPCREDYVDPGDDAETRREALADYRSDLRDWESFTRARREAAERVAERFDGEPWLLVSLKGPEDEALRREQVFVYVMTFRPTSECGDEEGDPLTTLRILPEPLPWPAPGETARHWLPAVRYANAIHGLIAAPDAGMALTLLEEEELGEVHYDEALDYAPLPNDGAFVPDCSCCGQG